MTTDDLREMKRKIPFEPFVIHMNDGKEYSVRDPEDLFIHPEWSVDAIVVLPKGRWSFIYLRNVASVTSSGTWPKARKRRGRQQNGD